jgi:diadenosine tetraphosphate (Ap4A) HIT family hydrolase
MALPWQYGMDFPYLPGHTLILPRRHVGSFFAVTEAERNAMLALLDATKAGLDAEFRPDGYNLGINDGPAAGQTVPHLHMHLIPRYAGDQAGSRAAGSDGSSRKGQDTGHDPRRNHPGIRPHARLAARRPARALTSPSSFCSPWQKSVPATRR